MFGDDFWRGLGLTPLPLSRALGRMLALIAAVVVLVLLSAVVRSALPFGVAALAFAEWERRRGVAWLGNFDVAQEANPGLFGVAIGWGYLIGAIFLAVGIAGLV